MRKTLVVLMLIVSSVLLVQAPALAPHLYKLDRHVGTKVGQGSWAYSGTTDCNGTVQITFTDGQVSKPKLGPADKNGTRKFRVVLHGSGPDRAAISSATCDGEPMTLPFTGVPVLTELLFGVSVVVAGGLLVRLGRRPVRGALASRGAWPGPPGDL